MKRFALLGALALAACTAAPPQEQVSTEALFAATHTAPEVVAALNTEREKAGLPTLREDPALVAAARAHAADMAAKGFFDHTAPDGSTPLRRMRAAGFDACYAAENIAKGQPDAASVLASWTASDGHRRNMFSPNPRAIGVAWGPENHWVMTLARAC